MIKLITYDQAREISNAHKNILIKADFCKQRKCIKKIMQKINSFAVSYSVSLLFLFLLTEMDVYVYALLFFPILFICGFLFFYSCYALTKVEMKIYK